VALPDYISLVGGTSRTTGISSAAVASASNVIGSAIDNATNLDDLADFEIQWSYSTAPTANKSLRLYAIYSYDGTNYEDGDTTNEPVRATLIRAWSPPADTATHRMVVGGCALLPYSFKLLVRNHDTGQTVTVTVACSTRKMAQIID